MPLYEAERHEPLIAADWNEGRAWAAIARIVADTNRTFDTEALWPIHPLDVSPERAPGSLKVLYYGAAGVILALNHLDQIGIAPLERDYIPTVRELAAHHREDIRTNEALRKYLGAEHASYLLGEAGILLLEWKLAPSDDLLRRLYAFNEEKIGDPRGLAWGSAGAMLQALFLHKRTGDSRWSDLFLRHFDALWDQWEYADDLGCHLWINSLYGSTEKRLGAFHGLVGNAFPMIRGRHLLPPDRRDEALGRIYQALSATASSEGGYQNWPNNIGATTRPKPFPMVVQYCNGAPGVVICMADFPKDSRWDMDALLERAGEFIWSVGPLVKLPSLCHGTPGNGYAFLKLYARTGDRKWLERARRFAMHSIDQNERALAQYGQRKYSLWTGDLGLAIYVADCISGTARFPTLDVF
jgi:hypothetical protein